MPREVDEPITVTLSPEGEPRAFVWRRFEYEVLGTPLAFFRRLPWWRTRGSLQRIDQEFWRVEATATGTMDGARIYELARAGEKGWLLATEWE